MAHRLCRESFVRRFNRTMKKLYNITLTSALILSLCLMSFIPASLKSISTWRELYFQALGYKTSNYLMPMGFQSLGFVMIGLIVLWTGYRQKERWAWFVMFTILAFFVFPGTLLPLLLQTRQRTGIVLSTINLPQEIKWILEGDSLAIWLAINVLTFPVMLITLLLPIKAFFWKSYSTDVSDKHNEQDRGLPFSGK